jgi:hypothetical protein
MKPRLFIHIGTHKTGSTAIQRAFRAGEQGPLREGVVRLEGCHFTAGQAWDQRTVEKFASELRDQAAKHDRQSCRFLLSSEGFSGEPLTGYADAPVVAARLHSITHEFDVTIIVFLRRQDDFIESLYTQKIHEGSSLSFEEFFKTIHPGCMNWQLLVASYAQEFGRENMVVRRYHPAFFSGPESLITDFCGIVGVRSEVLQQPLQKAHNQGYSMEAVELARRCNPVLDKDRRKQLRKLLQKVSPKPVLQSYSYLTTEARRQFLSGYADSNDQVRRDYPSGLNSTSLFPEPTEPSSEAVPHETLTPTLVGMLLEMKEAENRSGILRFVMRLERSMHAFRQWCSRSQRNVIHKNNHRHPTVSAT